MLLTAEPPAPSPAAPGPSPCSGSHSTPPSPCCPLSVWACLAVITRLDGSGTSPTTLEGPWGNFSTEGGHRPEFKFCHLQAAFATLTSQNSHPTWCKHSIPEFRVQNPAPSQDLLATFSFQKQAQSGWHGAGFVSPPPSSPNASEMSVYRPQRGSLEPLSTKTQRQTNQLTNITPENRYPFQME